MAGGAKETFGPLLYVIGYEDLAEISVTERRPQGLSSALFTRDLQEAEHYLSATGSDYGIANINIGTSGAEIGQCLWSEKATGGVQAAPMPGRPTCAR